MKSYDLERYKKAQRRDYQEALEEIRSGRKTSHWMWYIFPQLKGLGYSGMSDYYGITDLIEAQAYMRDPFLRDNLIQISEALLSVKGKSASEIFGYPDDLKLHSCMTLFSIAAPEEAVFTEVLDRFFAGKKDPGTLRLLKMG